MDRLDRSTIVALACALAVGFALWQLVSSIGYTASRLLIDVWEDESESPFAELSIGGVDIEYGQILTSGITLVLAALVAVPLVRYAVGLRTAEFRGMNLLD